MYRLSFFINLFNSWKRGAEAGVDANGKSGLPWAKEICSLVFEEACVDAGRSIAAFFAWCTKKKKDKAKRARPQTKAQSRHVKRASPPTYKKKHRDKLTFRIRAKGNNIKVGVSTLTLPKIGDISLGESSRKLRRLLRQTDPSMPARAKVLFVTLTEVAGTWYARINLEAAPLQAELCRKADKDVVGLDAGLRALAVAAKSDGILVLHQEAPKPLKQALHRLKRLSCLNSRKKKGGRHHRKSRRRIAKLQRRIANTRHACLHKISGSLAKTHSHVAVEDLHIAGMLKNRCLARSISDAGWGILFRQLEYKCQWYGSQFTKIDRFFPSSKTCCRCGWVAAAMPLKERTFYCDGCSLEMDRDLNAAANIARCAEKAVLPRAGDCGCGEPGSTRDASRGVTCLVDATTDAGQI